MNFEKIEEAYQLLLENSQLIENDLKTHIYDAIVEQNSFYLGAEELVLKLPRTLTN